jgi:hypothetical protein
MGKTNTRAQVKVSHGHWDAPFLKRDKDDVDLSCLVGKKIVSVGRIDQSGFPPNTASAEANFAIDYQDGKKVRRVVIGATDLGWWTEWIGERGTASRVDSLKDMVRSAWDNLVKQESLKIVYRPLGLRFYFAADDGSEILSFHRDDLKVLPANVRRHFTSKKPRDAEAVVAAIGQWLWAD